MQSFDIKIGSNVAEVSRVLSDTADKIIDQSKIAAINKSMAIMRTSVRKQVSARSGVPSKRIGKRIKLFRASKKRRDARLSFGTFNFRAITLKGKVMKTGVSYSGPGGRVKKPHSFEATMPKSGRTDFFHRKGKSRLPIITETVKILPVARQALLDAMPKLEKDFKRIYRDQFEFRLGKSIAKNRARE